MNEERVIIKITFSDYEKKAIQWARTYANDMVTTERRLSESNPFRYCILDMYKVFVKEKRLEKIELINYDLKQELYAESKRIFPEEMPPDKRRQICIFLYFMNHVFETYF